MCIHKARAAIAGINSIDCVCETATPVMCLRSRWQRHGNIIVRQFTTFSTEKEFTHNLRAETVFQPQARHEILSLEIYIFFARACFFCSFLFFLYWCICIGRPSMTASAAECDLF